MSLRSTLKETSLQRILGAGAARLRQEGLSGAAITAVMQDAGLTHGAFYSHFTGKDELVVAAFRHALTQNRPRWMGYATGEAWPLRLMRLAKRYLTAAHRDDLAASCALAALVSDAARAHPEFRRAYEKELRKSLSVICDAPAGGAGADPERFDEAISFMALCVGGISLARAVEEKPLSERILAACRRAVTRLPAKERAATDPRNLDPDYDSPRAEEKRTEASPELDQFPLKTYERIRYADTDRQGHVNNAVFSSMLETGRVEVLYAPGKPLASADCAFVIARLTLNFHAEVTWPGRVEIGTRVSVIGRTSITLEQALFQNGRCVATANTVIVHVNEATKRSQPLDETAVEHLESWRSPDDSAEGETR